MRLLNQEIKVLDYNQSMKKKILIFPLALFCLSMVEVNQEVELDAWMNARTNASNFKKGHKLNLATVLPKGTRGVVRELTKEFGSKNFGVKLEITNGPKKGQSYWVYYDKKNPGLKVLNEKPVKAPAPEDSAELIRNQHALREPNEAALEDSVTTTNTILKAAKDEGLVEPPKGDCKIITKPEATPVVSPKDDESHEELAYTPQAALQDLNSGNLTFIGRDLFPGDDQNRTCAYKNEKVFVLYHNCLASKREADATEIEIIQINGNGAIEFYKEAGQLRITTTQSPSVPANSNLAQLKKYKDTIVNGSYPACWVKSAESAGCYGTSITNSYWTKWADDAKTFWANPGAWDEAYKKIRNKIVETKF